MKKLFFFSLGLLLAMQSLTQVDSSYRYGGEGIFYKVFKQGGNTVVPYGAYIEYSMEQFYNDSLLADIKDRRLILAVDSTQVPPVYASSILGLSVGDSLVFKVATDSNRYMYQSFPWVKTGSFFVTTMKVENLLPSKEAALAVAAKYQKEQDQKDSLRNEAFLALESKRIEEYLVMNNINYSKTASGVYYTITKKGTGPNASNNNTILVNYTGKTMKGVIFDSNTMPGYYGNKPIEVPVGKGVVIKGWDDAFLHFNKGSKGMLFIPSPLAYGVRGSGPNIGANEILFFDVEVVDIRPNAPVKTAKPPSLKPAVKPKVKAKPTSKRQ